LQRFKQRGLLIQSDACENLCGLLGDDDLNLVENLNSILGIPVYNYARIRIY
jgi:hypothetical protein